MTAFPGSLLSPSRACSLMPFWFWNDVLEEREILRQIADFDAHGVYGFVIHPRVGLPRDCGWMSDTMLHFMQVAIEEAHRRRMKVMLYDEGMYPSGSSSGQVVAKYPHLACRGLALHDLSQPLPAGANLVQEIGREGKAIAIVDRPINAYIRGLHYIGEGPKEDEPPAGDILNPQTVRAVVELVHAKFAERFGKYFNDTVIGIFTDEPSAVGKLREKRVVAGTTGIVEQVSRILGYDFAPHLPSLWFDDAGYEQHRSDYKRAIRERLNETWYGPLSEWCGRNGTRLCGHPDTGDEIGAQRFFHIPGQDLVWRWVEPGKETALRGPESTQAKCSSSAMIHLGRDRNSNEFAGAYGAKTTFEEIRWLANWCFVRGVNLLIPHAFYYSVRGPRKQERPPQIGPHTREWDGFKSFADHCTRLSWLNTESRHLCEIAIVTPDDRCPWRAAEACFTHQRDFNYLDPHTLLNGTIVREAGIEIASMRYTIAILDQDHAPSADVRAALRPLIDADRVIRFGAPIEGDTLPSVSDAGALQQWIDARLPRPIALAPPAPAIRVRQIEKEGRRYLLVFNEGVDALNVTLQIAGATDCQWIDTSTGAARAAPARCDLLLKAFECQLLSYRA